MVIELNSWRRIAPRLKAYFMNLLQKQFTFFHEFFYFEIIFNPSCGLKINLSCFLKRQREISGKHFQPFKNQLYFCSDVLK